ncbi:copper amine oxidase [Georgenia satyanarayanai]|uniref:copper amine oxidase n=1 Tax=Georgenia satyanarayanai TaxID=860221 RepID=UPI00186AF709|nr:copper amine oxidase [Georgenia satyanarayanai]
MSTLRPTRTSAAVAAALALTLSLAACGADTDEDTGATPTQQETTTMAPEPDAMEDGEMSAVMPMGTGDPFADARTAAQHMPETAATLAAGFAAALDIPGEVDSDAATLRATMTSLLQEHVYLAGIAVATGYTTGLDSPEFEAAAATLDDNSVALADAVGSLAGDEQREAFLALWREHIGYFVDYAAAAAEGDDAGKEAALADLQAYTQDAGAFFEEVSGGELPAADIAASLEMHVSTLGAAIDDLAAGSPEAYASLREAAAHVGEGAAVISGGLATATDMSGDPADEAATLRADLTALLQEHVYLAGVAVFTAYTAEGGTESEAFTAAAEVLDANSVALSEAVGSLAGPEQGEAFLGLWREHIGYFVDYAVAVSTGDTEAADAALTELDAYRGEAGAFFEEISGGELPADAVAEGLAMHVQTLAGAIDSLNAALVQGS